MPNESDALLLRAGIGAQMIDPEKGAAALVVYTQMLQNGISFSFGDFLVDRGLISRIGLASLEQNLKQGDGQKDSTDVKTTWKIGDFELEELLGEGEHGSVFRATQISTGRPVALKILSPRLSSDQESLQRFLSEARISARLNHPNIVRCIRVAMADGHYYYAMELMEGGSVRNLLEKSGGRIDEKRTLQIGSQVASALGAAHQAGLVHRDVKPENILLTAGGQAMLGDLGLASPSKGSLVEKAQEDGEFWGTADYLAPEVIDGSSQGDARSDLYALGATLFELLVGQPPFIGNSPQEILRMHLYEQAPDVLVMCPDLSPETAALIRCLLLKKPEKRLPDAQLVVKAINQAMASNEAPALPQRLTPRRNLSGRKDRPAAGNRSSTRDRDRSRRAGERGAGVDRRSSRRTKEDPPRGWKKRK